jgi:hypothetical protein
MDANRPQPPTPQDSHDAELQVIALTGMTPDAAHTYLEFFHGVRALRRD